MTRTKTLFLALAILALNTAAIAQRQSKIELFGGYSLEDNVPCGSGCREPGVAFPPTIFNGWNASLTGYVYKSVGITADFSGHYSTQIVFDPVVGAHRYSYMFGPTYAFRGDVGSAFVHALFGEVSQGSTDLSNLNFTRFAWALGGGLDVHLSRRFSARIVQFDYERSSVPTFDNPPSAAQPVNGFRYSAGVVIRL
jgi:hypothetical protein